MGRPSSFNQTKAQAIIDAIAAGNYFEAACGAAGVPYNTFRRWMIKGKKARRGSFREFWEKVKKAEADAELAVVSKWQEHMPENWQACRDFLARRHPKRWCAKDEMKHGGSFGLTIQTVEGVDEDETLGRKTAGDKDAEPDVSATGGSPPPVA